MVSRCSELAPLTEIYSPQKSCGSDSMALVFTGTNATNYRSVVTSALDMTSATLDLVTAQDFELPLEQGYELMPRSSVFASNYIHSACYLWVLVTLPDDILLLWLCIVDTVIELLLFN